MAVFAPLTEDDALLLREDTEGLFDGLATGGPEDIGCSLR